MQERFPVGYQYHVSTRVDLSGTLTPPPEKDKPAPKPLALSGDSAVEFCKLERVREQRSKELRMARDRLDGGLEGSQDRHR